MPKTADPKSAAPAWRRALAWLAAHVRQLAAWLWAKLKAATTAVWTNVRDAQKPASKRVAWAAGGVAGAGALLGAALFAAVLLYALVLWPLTPSVGDLRDAREVHPSTVVSADGVVLTEYRRRNREWRSLGEVSPHVVEALVATEDRRFYEHGGMDLRRTAGAVVYTALGDRQGGSTITQQLARNLFPDEIGNAPSVTRKLKEAITARKIERVYTKDEILELYLNTVPFLYNAWGIEMAARTYFSTSSGDLDRLQAATLVGMLKGTSSYNPKRNPERALARRNVVLGQMVRFGDLDPAEAARLRDEPLRLEFERQPMQRSRAPHFTEHVRVMLEDWADDHGHSLYGDGLTVHTTLDWRMQERAAATAESFGNALQAVADVEWGLADAGRLGGTTAPYVTASRRTEPFERFWSLRADAAGAFTRDTDAYRAAVARGRDGAAVVDSLLGDPAFRDSLRQEKMRLEVALTAVDPETGHVKVWVGGRDFERSAYDRVARARRQPGSTFKPFLYARALEEGWRPDDLVADAPVEIELADGVVWQPTNASGTTTGEMTTLRDGLATSKNTVAARLVQDVGARDVARTARRMGVRSDLDAVPSLALGTSEVSLLEMTAAYATIAAGGLHRPPVLVTHVTDRDGNEVARFEPEPRGALDADVAVDLLDMMRGVVDGGTGSDVRRLFGARGDLAGKTGTTQDGADGWFLLMHPELVTGAWVGFDDPRVTFRSSYWGQGGHNALRLVGDFQRSVQRGGLVDTGREFPRPPEPEEGEPGLWDRFAGWVGGLFEDGREADVPEDYAPRTPGRGAGDGRDRQRDDVTRGGETDDLPERRALDWLDRAWIEVDQIEDPLVRAAAREALRQAAREVDQNAEGWVREARRIRDEAIREARREVRQAERDAREAAREAARDVDREQGVFFEDETVAEEDVLWPIEEAFPDAPPEPPAEGRPPGREGVAPADGRTGW
jgi:penicillin-binding protein 1A